MLSTLLSIICSHRYDNENPHHPKHQMEAPKSGIPFIILNKGFFTEARIEQVLHEDFRQ